MSTSRLILGSVVTLIGLSLLFDMNIMRFVVPAVLIYFGLRILISNEGSDPITRSQAHENKIDRVLVFSGMSEKNVSEDFEGGSIVAIFGGGELDLREAVTKEKEISLDLVAVFGGIKVIVPKTWQVNTEGVGILGAFENNTSRDKKTTATLKVEGVGIFGGVEVAN